MKWSFTIQIFTEENHYLFKPAIIFRWLNSAAADVYVVLELFIQSLMAVKCTSCKHLHSMLETDTVYSLECCKLSCFNVGFCFSTVYRLDKES